MSVQGWLASNDPLYSAPDSVRSTGSKDQLSSNSFKSIQQLKSLAPESQPAMAGVQDPEALSTAESETLPSYSESSERAGSLKQSGPARPPDYKGALSLKGSMASSSQPQGANMLGSQLSSRQQRSTPKPAGNRQPGQPPTLPSLLPAPMALSRPSASLGLNSGPAPPLASLQNLPSIASIEGQSFDRAPSSRPPPSIPSLQPDMAGAPLMPVGGSRGRQPQIPAHNLSNQSSRPLASSSVPRLASLS